MASGIDDEEVKDIDPDGVLDGFNMDIMDMSDDELADMTNDQIAEASMKSGAAAQAKPETESSDAVNEEDELDSPAAKVDDESAEDDSSKGAEGDLAALAAEESDESDEAEDEPKDLEAEKSSADKTADNDKAGDEKAKSPLDAKIDYKQEYEKLLAPFQANGRQIQVDNVDDAVTLMKMGANYNKKMAVLKPSLKVVKMLEKHDLLDETKLSHLIDIAAHDPAAITKLLKDAKLDPLDIDTDTAPAYVAKDHSVNDSQMELDQIIEDIKDNASFPKTIDVISNQWDAESKTIALKDPKIITVIDEHIQSGVFDQIVSVMDKERALGRLTGKADLVAYLEIGQALTSQGAFNKGDTATQSDEADAKALAAKEARDKKRAAAASTQASKKSATPEMLDPLSMSDDEFEKASAQGLYR